MILVEILLTLLFALVILCIIGAIIYGVAVLLVPDATRAFLIKLDREWAKSIEEGN